MSEPFKVLDISKTYGSPAHYARMTWQVLFDEYRNNGGDLSQMNDMSCDLGIIEKLIDEGYGDGSEFLWNHDDRLTTLKTDKWQMVGEYIRVRFDPEAWTISFTREPNE